MAEPALAMDIVLAIMEIAPRSVSLNLSMTCRTLRKSGAKCLLGGGVSLPSNKHILAFMIFMRADGGSRIRHLRSLEISVGNISHDAVCQLKGLVTHPFLKLESLALLDAEAFLMSDTDSTMGEQSSSPKLAEALASLTTLKHLKIDRSDQHALAFVRSMLSSLLTASLVLEPFTSWTAIDDPDERNPILLLIRSSETLQELSGTGFEMDPTLIKYDVVYPSVRRISAEYTSPTMPGTLVYIHAYPNLEYLSLSTPFYRFEDDDEHPFDALNRFIDTRVANRADQANYARTWQHLQEVVGSIVDLYVLGLACHVPKVRLLDTFSEEKCEYFEDVLSDTQPSSLVMAVAEVAVFGHGGPLYSKLQQPSAQKLRTLDLEIRFSPDEGDMSLDEVSNAIRDALAPASSLRSLVLTLNHRLLAPPRRRSGSCEGLCPLEQELRRTDLRAYEVRFRDAMKSLTEVSIHTTTTSSKPRDGMSANAGDDGASVASSEGTVEEIDREFASFMMEGDDPGW